ncbi:78 kDa glucose-regulated protein [Trichoderma lentiforme]|uniref:78 kDa glucose-regulated protein n=1 Tax=Trichoderma lentiforme TaxID=1567552 RepID=A0A9P4X697_9HYPO|nr:78 kDa glucose-regulated protein [Trichoderma lentiforme]
MSSPIFASACLSAHPATTANQERFSTSLGFPEDSRPHTSRRHLIATLMFLVLILCLFPALNAVKAHGGGHDRTGTVIGIDLGTTNSHAAVMQQGKIAFLLHNEGSTTLPICVASPDVGFSLVKSVKDPLEVNPKTTDVGVGKDIERWIPCDLSGERTLADIDHLPYNLGSREGQPVFNVKRNGLEGQFAVEDVYARIFANLRRRAEVYLGKKVTHAVITAPARFNSNQRLGLINAASVVGLNVLRIVSKSMAAVDAVGLGCAGLTDKHIDDEHHFLVYHFGGGTLKVSLLYHDMGLYDTLAEDSQTRLGGEDFNEVIVNYFAVLYNERNAVDITKDPTAMGKLYRAAEKAKRELSTRTNTHLEIQSFHERRDFSGTLTRTKFEELSMGLFQKLLEPIERLLKLSNVSKDQIDDIILVGGSTHIPKVRALIEEFFEGKKAINIIQSSRAVVFGAAYEAARLSDDPDVWLSLWELLEAMRKQYSGLTLGVQTSTGAMAKLIQRSTRMPAIATQTFSTATDNQTSVFIQVFEGERYQARDNNLLGQFWLTGIPPMLRGIPRIEVALELDSNGNIKAVAYDTGSGAEKSILIPISEDRIAEEHLERMVLAAVQHEEQDSAMRELLNSQGSHLIFGR